MNLLNSANPIVDKLGKMTQVMRTFTLLVSRSIPLTGNGSPEGVVEAEQLQFYVDLTPGNPHLYIKIQPDIGGDKSQGWEVA